MSAVKKSLSPFWASVLYAQAHEAGMAAGKAHQPVPMIVSEHANPLNDNSPVVKVYAPVMGGVCGFAWIKIRPARGAFVNWLKVKKIGRVDSYSGGYSISVHQFGQSMECKEAYAGAFAQVLNDHDVLAYAESRED